MFVYGWERDPNTHPEAPVHEHLAAPTRERLAPTQPVSLTQALDRAWDEVTLRAEAPP